MSRVKITVLKKVNFKEFYGENLPVAIDEKYVTSQCRRFREGQEFLVDGHNCPEGFCGWAFADIQRDLTHILYGGSYPWMKREGEAISCCTSGLRPVIFKLERIEDD
jgi:uncharacterized repeat protein (TIGR04076 family)